MNTQTNGKARDAPMQPIPDALVKIEPPRRTDLQPSYASVMKPDSGDDTHGWYGSMINTLGNCIGTMGALPCCICCPNPYRPVDQGNVGLVTKFGRFARAVDPGLVRINPLSEKLIQVDVKIQIVEVPRQVCMTKDNVNLQLNSVIYYHITSPHRAAFGISSVRQALMERTQTTLRHVVGARLLQDVIERREEIAQSIRDIMDDTASSWGVVIESMLVKDIIFSQELQDSLSMAAQSKRTGEAKVIAARAEVESAKLMRQAADILSSAPAMQIRYLEAMQAMAKSANSKVIFLPAMNQSVAQQAQMMKLADDETVPTESTGFYSVGKDIGASSRAGPSDYGITSGDGMRSAADARIVENI